MFSSLQFALASHHAEFFARLVFILPITWPGEGWSRGTRAREARRSASSKASSGSRPGRGRAPRWAWYLCENQISERGNYVKIKQTYRGSFSAVSTPNLQVNTRWKALDEIYKIYMLLHRSDLNISENFRQTSSHFLAKCCKNSSFLNSFL